MQRAPFYFQYLVDRIGRMELERTAAMMGHSMTATGMYIGYFIRLISKSAVPFGSSCTLSQITGFRFKFRLASDTRCPGGSPCSSLS